MFVREGILDPLSTALVAILKDDDATAKEEQAHRAVGVLLLFCQVAQADSRVKEAFASRPIMIREKFSPWTRAGTNLLLTVVCFVHRPAQGVRALTSQTAHHGHKGYQASVDFPSAH